MDLITRVFTSAASHVVLLLVVLPAFGAILVRLMRRAGFESVYYTAVTNAWTGLVLAAVMLGCFLSGAFADPDEPLPQDRLVSSIQWHGELVPAETETTDGKGKLVRFGPNIRITVGVSGVSVWLIALTVAVTVVFIQSLSPDDERLVLRLSWILLTEAALIGTLAALDVVLLSFCSLLSVVGLSILIAEFGGPRRREAARRFFVGQLASGMLLMLGLVGLAVSHWWMQVSDFNQSPDLTFSLRAIVGQIPFYSTGSEPALDFWNTLAPWLFLILCGGLFLRLPIPPLHHGWLRAAEQADPRVAALIAVGYLPASLHVLLRVVMPIFADQSIDLGYRLLIWGTAAGAALALVAASTTSRPRRLAAISLSVSTIALTTSFISLPPISQGAALLTIGTAAALALALLSPQAASPDESTSNENQTEIFGASRRALTALPVLSLALLPPTAGFWGALLIIEGLFPYDPKITTAILVTFAVLGWTMWDEISRSNESQHGPSIASAKPAGGVATLIPIAALLVCASLFPASVLNHVAAPSPEPETSASLESDINSASTENRSNRSQTRPSK